MSARSHRLRALLAAGLVALVVAGCSDAHTEEEKAWADDGVDPSTVFVAAAPRFQPLAKALSEAYQRAEEYPARFLYMNIEDGEDVEARIDEASGPVVYLGDPDEVADLGPDDITTIGEEPLAGIGFGTVLTEEPSIETLAGLGRLRAGLCPEDTECGEQTAEVFARSPDAGFFVRDAERSEALDTNAFFIGDPDELVEEMLAGDLDVALVPRAYGVVQFPRLANYPLPRTNDAARPQVAASFGDSESADAFVQWVEQGLPLLRPMIETTSGIIPIGVD